LSSAKPPKGERKPVNKCPAMTQAKHYIGFSKDDPKAIDYAEAHCVLYFSDESETLEIFRDGSIIYQSSKLPETAYSDLATLIRRLG
jgi:hypothetical protein